MLSILVIPLDSSSKVPNVHQALEVDHLSSQRFYLTPASVQLVFEDSVFDMTISYSSSGTHVFYGENGIDDYCEA